MTPEKHGINVQDICIITRFRSGSIMLYAVIVGKKHHFHSARQVFKKNIVETRYMGRKIILRMSGAVTPALLPTSQNP
jgi:hypothetical protein